MTAAPCLESLVATRGQPLLARRRRSLSSAWASMTILLSFCGLLFFHGLSAGDLYRNEGLRARVAWEMLRSRQWLVPTLYGEPLLTKPPGHYLAIVALSLPTGDVTERTARLPSALAATMAVLLFYWYFARQLGRVGGLVAGLGLPMSFLWLDKAGAAEIDMLHCAWVVAAVVFLLRALEAEEEPGARTWPWWLAALGCVAGGVLTKWTAPVFFYGTAVPLLWRRGRLALLISRRHLGGAALGATLCIGWALAAAGSVGWRVFVGAVVHEAWGKLAPSHHRHSYPWGETLVHPLLLLAAALPWSVFALGALRPGFTRCWDARGRRLLEAMHCWVWPNLVFWTLLPEHSPRHAFPLFPGLAGLGAMAWMGWLSERFPWPWVRQPAVGNERGQRWRPRTVLCGLVIAWLAVKLIFVHVVVPARGLVERHQPLASKTFSIRSTGQQLAAAVPGGELLHVFRLKDEGVMFYYGRPVRRLAGLRELSEARGPAFCILDDEEWRASVEVPASDTILRLRDGQGHAIYLVRTKSVGQATSRPGEAL